MKKKILTILVCASVMLTTACDKSGISSASTGGGSNESSSTSTKSSSSESSTTSSESSSTSSESSSSESSTTTESESSSAPAESSTPEVGTDSGFVHGKQDGNTYTSAFLGIKAEFADGWTIVTDDVLAQTNGIADMSDENANEALDTNAILYELMASTEAIANVNIVVENLNITNGGKSLTGEEYIDLAIGNIEAAFLIAGIENVETEKSTINFLGSESACISTKLSNQELEMIQKMIPISKGAYMVMVTFSGANEDEITSAMNMFQSI